LEDNSLHSFKEVPDQAVSHKLLLCSSLHQPQQTLLHSPNQALLLEVFLNHPVLGHHFSNSLRNPVSLQLLLSSDSQQQELLAYFNHPRDKLEVEMLLEDKQLRDLYLEEQPNLLSRTRELVYLVTL